MKKLLIAAALIGFSAATASAADLPVRAYTKAPEMVPAYSWTGFYVGVNGGYAWNDRTVTFRPNDPASLSGITELGGTPPPP